MVDGSMSVYSEITNPRAFGMSIVNHHYSKPIRDWNDEKTVLFQREHSIALDDMLTMITNSHLYIDFRKMKNLSNASYDLIQESHVNTRLSERIICTDINRHSYIDIWKMQDLSNANYNLIQERHVNAKLSW